MIPPSNALENLFEACPHHHHPLPLMPQFHTLHCFHKFQWCMHPIQERCNPNTYSGSSIDSMWGCRKYFSATSGCSRRVCHSRVGSQRCTEFNRTHRQLLQQSHQIDTEVTIRRKVHTRLAAMLQTPSQSRTVNYRLSGEQEQQWTTDRCSSPPRGIPNQHQRHPDPSLSVHFISQPLI